MDDKIKDRINDKTEQIELFIEEISSVSLGSFEEYSSSFQKRAVCERYAEKIIEAVVDLAFLIIKMKDFPPAENDENSFTILVEHNIISKNLFKKLVQAKGMRNIIVHEYGSLDNRIVYNAISKQLIPDVKEFIENIKNAKTNSKK
jgi:uncharacterized protein YutE (UPF0331/DUF86 family)